VRLRSRLRSREPVGREKWDHLARSCENPQSIARIDRTTRRTPVCRVYARGIASITDLGVLVIIATVCIDHAGPQYFDGSCSYSGLQWSRYMRHGGESTPAHRPFEQTLRTDDATWANKSVHRKLSRQRPLDLAAPAPRRWPPRRWEKVYRKRCPPARPSPRRRSPPPVRRS
jgi:hypothetical protein